MTVDLAQPIPVHGYQVACAGGVLEGETIRALAAEQGAAGGAGPRWRPRLISVKALCYTGGDNPLRCEVSLAPCLLP